MKKEIIIAILIGAMLGLGLAGASRWQSLKEKLIKPSPVVKKETAAKPTNPPKKTTPTPKAISLNVYEPDNEVVVSKPSITIKGGTIPRATVILIGNEDEVILEADQNGNFKTDFTLSGGVNDIEITAYDNKSNEVKKILTVTYSTAKF